MVNRVGGLGATNWGALHWVQLRTEGLSAVYWTNNRFKSASETQGLSWVKSKFHQSEPANRVSCLCVYEHA